MSIFTPQPNRATILLIRHGATSHNLENPPRLQGQGVDSELSAEGLAQSGRVGMLLSQLPLAAAYCSPLRRAFQTAEAIVAANESLTEPPATLDGLKEVAAGRWEGLSWAEVAKQDPVGLKMFQTQAEHFGYPGGENIGQVVARAKSALDAIADKHIGEMVAVVAHSVVNRSVIGSILGISLSTAHLVPQENCTLNVLVKGGKGWKVKVINSTCHLECAEVFPLAVC